MFTDVVNGFSPGMLRAAMAMAGFEGSTTEIAEICKVTSKTAHTRLRKGEGWRQQEILRLIIACRMSASQVMGIWFNLPEEIQQDIDENSGVISFRPPKNPDPVNLPGLITDPSELTAEPRPSAPTDEEKRKNGIEY